MEAEVPACMVFKTDGSEGVVMPPVRELGALEVKNLTSPGLHGVGGVTGLYLNINRGGSRSWILRATVGEKRRDIGLGGYPDVSLRMARERAREAKAQIRKGIDPIVQRRAARSALVAEQLRATTFRQVATRYVQKKSREFKTAKQTQTLAGHLESYVFPMIGNMVVDDITRAHIVKILMPIWETKTETATRVRATVERILDLAGAEGLRTGDNPARWRGNLDLTLPQPGKISKVTHYRAMSVEDLPAFMRELTKKETIGAMALRFAILTAARSGEVRGATWEEIDLDARVWTVPSERMKGSRVHKVPLTPAAVRLLKSLPRAHDIVFPNPKGQMLSDMTLSKVPKLMGHQVTQHGFRATFRTWAQEHTNYPEEVPELALGHVNSDRTRAAYARSELLDKRRRLMNEWERFCYHGLPADKGKVVSIRGRKASASK